MNYKVGDEVRVRKDLEEKEYDGVPVLHVMLRQRGWTCHIERAWTGLDGVAKYELVEDDLSFTWTEAMFEPRKKHQPIIIYQKDNETIVALDKETQIEGRAICSKDDEFNFMYGARLAFDRLDNALAEAEREKVRKSNPETVKEKREWLSAFCHGKACPNCILNAPTCRCGFGAFFDTKRNGEYTMTDAEINLAYALVKATEGK